jgi:hypothetical protein
MSLAKSPPIPLSVNGETTYAISALATVDSTKDGTALFAAVVGGGTKKAEPLPNGLSTQDAAGSLCLNLTKLS